MGKGKGDDQLIANLKNGLHVRTPHFDVTDFLSSSAFILASSSFNCRSSRQSSSHSLRISRISSESTAAVSARLEKE